MKCNFSSINLQYLIQARDIARKDVDCGSILLGMEKELSKELAEISPQGLSMVTRIKIPLIAPHQHTLWWKRFLRALDEGRTDEAQAIMEHANLIALEGHHGSRKD